MAALHRLAAQIASTTVAGIEDRNPGPDVKSVVFGNETRVLPVFAGLVAADHAPVHGDVDARWQRLGRGKRHP